MKSIIILLLITSIAEAQTALHTARQAYRDARLTNIESTGTLVFAFQGQPLSVEAREIVRWSSDRTTTPGSSAALEDGSWLAGQLQWPSDRKMRIVSKWFEPVERELDSLRAVLVNSSPGWPETQSRQSQMLQVTGSHDVLWKRNSESQSGLSASGIVTVQIKKSIDATSPDRAVWNFRSQPGGAPVEMVQADVTGVSFSPILRRTTPPCPDCITVHLIDGSRLLVREVKRRDDGRVECRLASGLTLVSLDEADQFVDAIAQITAQPDGITWLTDTEPARYRLLESDSRVPWPLGRNQDLFGKRLFDRQGQSIDRALVIHSPAQVAYRWDGKAAKLHSTLELISASSEQQTTDSYGSIQAEVLVARNGQLVSAWQSETLRTGQSPLTVEVDVSGSQLIVLLVDQADLGTTGDHAMWRDVRIVTP